MKINDKKTLRAIFLIRIATAIFASNVFGVQLTYSQTYSSLTTANCGKCGKAVSSSAKVGDSCPHCGVRWGKENTTTTNSIINSTKNTGIDPFAIESTTPSIVPIINAPKSILINPKFDKYNPFNSLVNKPKKEKGFNDYQGEVVQFWFTLLLLV